MAQKIQTLFIDDLDGSEAAGTVSFSLDGTQYEIDLSSTHTDDLHGILERYIAHARRVGHTARRASRSSRSANNGLDTAKIREWAKGQGIDIKERGRIPANVIEKYEATVGA